MCGQASWAQVIPLNNVKSLFHVGSFVHGGCCTHMCAWNDIQTMFIGGLLNCLSTGLLLLNLMYSGYSWLSLWWASGINAFVFSKLQNVFKIKCIHLSAIKFWSKSIFELWSHWRQCLYVKMSQWMSHSLQCLRWDKHASNTPTVSGTPTCK